MAIMFISNKAKKDFIAFVTLCIIAGLAFFFYSQGYNHVPGDDVTVGITYGKTIAETGTVNSFDPRFPSLNKPLYENWVIPEFPLHIILAVFYQFFGDQFDVLKISNFIILGLFVFSVFPLYLVGKEIFKKRFFSLLFVFLLIFSYFYGRAFWGGHYAQIMGMSILSLAIYFLVKHSQKQKFVYLTLAVLFTVFLYPVHILTFLLSVIVVASYLTIFFAFYAKKRIIAYLFFAIFAAGALIFLFFLKTAPSGGAKFLPNFDIEIGANSFQDIYRFSFDSIAFIAPLIFFGAYWLLKNKHMVIVVWFLTAWLLSQTSLLDIPFFSTRFNEYIIASLAFILAAGIYFIALLLARERKIVFGLFASFIIILIPFGFHKQISLANCYIHYCPGLHPATILDEDYEAFKWIKVNTPKDSVFVAVQKFGWFLPIVGERKIDALSAHIFQNEFSAKDRWKIAIKNNIDYVFWDALFDKYGDSYAQYKIYSEDGFKDGRYFTVVYNKDRARIYKVEEYEKN